MSEEKEQKNESASPDESNQPSQEEQIKALKAEVETLKKEREILVSGLPSAIALQYSQISNHKQGIVLAPIQAGVCGACKLSLRAQVINEVQIGQKVVTCDNCSRILYIEAP